MTYPGTGLVAIYRWRVDPADEPAFRDRWERETRTLHEAGSCGSLLGRGSDGTMVAIALWPDAATRDAAFARSASDEPWPVTERLETILVEPLLDLWDSQAWQEIGASG